LLTLNPMNGAVLSTQVLAKVRDRLPGNLNRRLAAAHLAHVEGVLVCPTNAGAVLGLDPLTGQILWAFAYDEPKLKERPAPFGAPPVIGPAIPRLHWKASAPIIQGGRVLLAPPDAPVLA